jgi:hypothetical protein
MPKQGINPFRGNVIPKGRMEWALEQTLSISAAAKLLRVSYNTFKKYAKFYDLFEQNKNPAGVGIPRRGDTGFSTARIQDIFAGKHPNYPHYKLQDRLLKNGYLAQECNNCGFEGYRGSDMRSPLLLDFLDRDPKNHELANLRLLCYNCFFILKDAGKMLATPKNVDSLRKRMQQVWREKEDVK